MRVLVTGAAGMLGSAVVPYLREQEHDVIATDIVDGWSNLDVRDFQFVTAAVKAYRPDIVAHFAAETSLEFCEDDPDHAWRTNALGTKNVALACRAASVTMAYISSAGIFDGTKHGPYTEFDTPNPINVYGASKYAGEQYVHQYVTEAYTVRCGWMMGGGPAKDHKFVSHIVKQLKAGITQIHAVSDKLGSPTYARDFAKSFETLIRSEQFGLYHMVSPGVCSRFDVALAIVEMLGYGDTVTVLPASSAQFNGTFYAPRPYSEAMRNYVLELEGRQEMRPWRVALAEYLKEWA